ncbi:hypothetical protein STRIP9103_07013 [Streptomyces ipomoeae 91-03]|uniref:Uncharacterized protein n=1 Tax=Streptomyces ipomoeae 91-03 TaxID=698759 RepID=L1L1R5_9ACTN|nr:hypothetical protein STRIP9103_07013 [Streptomyces ipomoeae 91-03]
MAIVTGMLPTSNRPTYRSTPSAPRPRHAAMGSLPGARTRR